MIIYGAYCEDAIVCPLIGLEDQLSDATDQGDEESNIHEASDVNKRIDGGWEVKKEVKLRTGQRCETKCKVSEAVLYASGTR